MSADTASELLRRRIAELGPWFHNLEIDGVQTAPTHFLGDYPREKFERFSHALPTDLTGLSVLDIGCNAGFYSLEMKRRGAKRVLGIDSEPLYLEQARFVSHELGVDIEYRLMSVFDIALLRERFDLVLFMGVLYHLRHPLLALDLLYEHVVGDLLIFQSMLRGSRDTGRIEPDYPFSEIEVFDRADYPKLHFVEQKYTGDESNWWIPNRACAEGILRSAGFEVIAHPENEVFVCRRGLLPDPLPRAVYPARGI